MMEAFTGSPMTLVVKAPNQEIGDQTVECFLDWTVQKLKKHLSAVYPTNPHERSQRIIYSGKLLQDNLLLKDVLSVSDAQDRCTVHLVCTPTSEELARQKKEGSKTWASLKRSSSTVLPGGSSTDGLRHRTNAPSSPSTSSSPMSRSMSAPGPMEQQQQQQQYPAGFTNATSLPSPPGVVPVPHPGMMPTGAMSPQQLQWMQHMYAQQMYAHQLTYMQYASMMAGSSGQPAWPQGYPMASPWLQPATTANQPHPHLHHHHPHHHGHHHHHHQPHPAAPAAENIPPPQGVAMANNNLNAAPQAPQAPQGPQVMNVGGGQAVAADDNEEGVRRDWLDWTFTLCRFGILLSIVYFYSSINRFLVVAGAMFMLYLYQAGFFQLRRRNRPPVTPPPQQPAPQREDGDEDAGSDANDSQPEESDSSTSVSDDTDGNTAAEPEEPPPPGILATAWVFIATFFTSIIPQGPGQQFPAN